VPTAAVDAEQPGDEPTGSTSRASVLPVNFRTLDLNLLRVFDEVMAERNLTRAATTLSMTQPAVSNALRRLRDALHDELLVRVGYGVQPTPRALELWPAVRSALDGLRSAVQADGGFDAAASRETFVMAMADATAASLIPPLVRRLQAEAPGVSLRARPLLTRDPRAALASGELDLAVGYFPAAIAAIDTATMQQGVSDTFAHRRLYDGEYVCVMRADHPMARATLDLEAFCAARHLLQRCRRGSCLPPATRPRLSCMPRPCMPSLGWPWWSSPWRLGWWPMDCSRRPRRSPTVRRGMGRCW
jgi:DNA-binding transcriptional LysR family regulator